MKMYECPSCGAALEIHNFNYGDYEGHCPECYKSWTMVITMDGLEFSANVSKDEM